MLSERYSEMYSLARILDSHSASLVFRLSMQL